MMAAADLKSEITCSICQDIFIDPVTLPCGHNFCQGCTESTWELQKSIKENPSCPECRQPYQREPELKKNVRLGNIAMRFLCTYPQENGSVITASKKCPVHHKLFEYFCCDDGAYLCKTCCLFGDHRRHRLERLNETSEKKKEELRNFLEELPPEREETEGQIRRLQERRRELVEKADIKKERVTVLFRDIREQLETLEKKILGHISRQEEALSVSLMDQILQMEKKKDELSMKIRHIEDLCNTLDPLTFLQESSGAAFCGSEEGHNKRRKIENTSDPTVEDLDEGWISETLFKGLDRIVTMVKEWRIYGQEAVDMSFNINTAYKHISVLGDKRTVSYSLTDQYYPQTLERFQDYAQVLSNRSFPSGQHYWEVEGSESGRWMVGVAYPSIDRKGDQSCIGNNNKSWCLFKWDKKNYSVIHERKETKLDPVPSFRRIRISLDYEAGHLSFYALGEEIRLLHTFIASFTEPLHAAFWVGKGTCNHIPWVRNINLPDDVKYQDNAIESI